MSDDGAAEGCGKRARGDGAEGVGAAASSSTSSSSSSHSTPSSSSSPSSPPSSSSSRADRAARRATGAPAPAPPRTRRRTAAERARLADLFLDVIGVVVAHNRGQFAHECWQCQYLCRETRYVAGVTLPGSIADLMFHGCRLGGVSKLLEEARKCKSEGEGATQLIRAVKDDNAERVRQLVFRLGCPAAVVNAQTSGGSTALLCASSRGHEAIAGALLAHGADVNIMDRGGWTPLIEASYNSYVAIMRLLCGEPGIDLAPRNEGMTALGWALRHKRAKVAAFLRSRGAPE